MNQPASAHPVIEPLHAGDYAAPRSDTSTVPKQAVHQTVYTADHYTEADYLPAENGMLYNAADGANTPLSRRCCRGLRAKKSTGCILSASTMPIYSRPRFRPITFTNWCWKIF